MYTPLPSWHQWLGWLEVMAVCWCTSTAYFKCFVLCAGWFAETCLTWHVALVNSEVAESHFRLHPAWSLLLSSMPTCLVQASSAVYQIPSPLHTVPTGYKCIQASQQHLQQAPMLQAYCTLIVKYNVYEAGQNSRTTQTASKDCCASQRANNSIGAAPMHDIYKT